MQGKLKGHWKFTTFLFAVGCVEFIIVALYLSVNLQLPPATQLQNNSYAVLGIKSMTSLPVEAKQPLFRELFKDNSGIEKRLPKLLHDYFKETQGVTFSPAELVGLLEFELSQVKQFTLRKDAVVLHMNPHQPFSDEAIKSISIRKELLASELKDMYKTTGSNMRVAHQDYEITAQPKPGNTLNSDEKMLALTFDDGPDGNTHALLDTLDKYEASATFFVLGQKVAGGVGVLQRMVRDGHEIGNHSWSHPDLRKLTPQQVTSQIADTQAAIKDATGATPLQMRPPYGAISPVVQQVVVSQGLNLAMWSVDTNDWRDRDPEVLYHRIMSTAHDRGIILLHDIHFASVQAVIRAIPDLKRQGFQLVTVSRLEGYR